MLKSQGAIKKATVTTYILIFIISIFLFYQLMTSAKFPINEIMKCNKIGLTSGASAPEKLVQNFIFEIKKYTNVSIQEFVNSKENVTFKLPKILNK